MHPPSLSKQRCSVRLTLAAIAKRKRCLEKEMREARLKLCQYDCPPDAQMLARFFLLNEGERVAYASPLTVEADLRYDARHAETGTTVKTSTTNG